MAVAGAAIKCSLPALAAAVGIMTTAFNARSKERGCYCRQALESNYLGHKHWTKCFLFSLSVATSNDAIAYMISTFQVKKLRLLDFQDPMAMKQQNDYLKPALPESHEGAWRR